MSYPFGEMEFIAGTQYFTIESQVYGLNLQYGLIVGVDNTGMPLSATTFALAPGNSVTIRGTVLRTTHDGGLECWEVNSGQWEPVELFYSYGDALPTGSTLLGSVLGINLAEDMEELFYSYGNPPTLESINKWVEDRKALRAPNVCPLNDCKQALRRPHALKARNLFFSEVEKEPNEWTTLGPFVF
ncbi:hypothetical protein FRC11_013040 [Ceratobasidium sp. 423]|nr:hypothetical protein FRC11_013040 [Ceratobasidium sp. 423]